MFERMGESSLVMLCVEWDARRKQGSLTYFGGDSRHVASWTLYFLQSEG